MKDFTCIYILLVLNVVPFRRPRYRTSHCYSELSGDYWDKLSHPRLLTFLQVFMHRRKQQGRELGSGDYIVYLELYIANCIYIFIYCLISISFVY